jgi:hypothetical protein
MRRKVVCTSINSVGIGQTASLDLPVGKRRYFGVYALYKTNAAQATIEADITEIRVIANGKVQRRFSAADLNVINATYGVPFTLGMIPILLSMPSARTIDGEEGLAWGTADVSTLRIEFDISGAAVAPTLTAFAEVDDVLAPLGPIVKWFKESVTAAGATTLNLTTLPKRDSYAAIHARSALITRMKVTVDGLEIFDVDRATYLAMLERRPEFALQANNYSLIFNDSSQVTDALPMVKIENGQVIPVQEFRVDLTFSGAGTVVLVSERVGNPE